MYGFDCIPLSSRNIKDAVSVQGTIVKGVLGLGKRNRHSNLLQALNIDKVDKCIVKNTLNFYNRLCKVDSPASKLQCEFLSHYLKTGNTIEGTLIHKIVSFGYSPIDVMFKDCKINLPQTTNNGIVDSLKFLLYHDNYVKPWSDEFYFVKMLTRAF